MISCENVMDVLCFVTKKFECESESDVFTLQNIYLHLHCVVRIENRKKKEFATLYCSVTCYTCQVNFLLTLACF